MTRPPVLALVGGFLGAGKTTLLIKAAELLRGRGIKPAIITNDQGSTLLDTRLAEMSGLEVDEVAGGCFCCQFAELLDAADALRAHRPDVIFAEPVGSCIDIASTVLKPLRESHSSRFHLAPFTVLVDPRRARDLFAPDADPLTSYLFRSQIEEADVVVTTKADLDHDTPDLPEPARLRVSGRTGAGVAEWLDLILGSNLTAGSHPLEVDYERYARAETALAWLDWSAVLTLRTALSASSVIGPLLDRLDSELAAAGVCVMHLKILDQSAQGYIRASICANGEEPAVEGDLTMSPAAVHEITLNLRAAGSHETLRWIMARAAAELPGQVDVVRFDAFRPSPPRPPRAARTNST